VKNVATAVNVRLPAMLRAPRSFSDILLAGGVVAIVALMILPIPLLLIDILVAANVLFGVGLLLLALYIPGPTAFASFPSVLLLTTLFRLSLSIAITRLILLNADAGHIIETFGELVVGGNLIVGIVVFLIITVVQFIVIAKGAERVAEVSARFTLDAMPGKQLSIDSDLRSGLIDKDDARRRRRHLEVESQLHGALDGAMKFVKGDAIAGIVIIIINILGGLAIGVLQRDMPLDDALHTYSILTIGDGLVSQIPALLSAISAGLIVTRTVGEEQDSHLGASIGREVGGYPRVILTGGVLALLLALVPGFPWPVFLAFGLPLTAFGLWSHRHQSIAIKRMFTSVGFSADEDAKETEASSEEPTLKPLPSVIFEVTQEIADTHGTERLLGAVARAAEGLREEFGAPISNPVVRISSELSGYQYRLRVFGVRLPEATWATGAAGDDGFGRLERTLMLALRSQLGQFAGIQETSNLLNDWSREYPDLIKEMLRAASPQRVSEVLRRLLDEGIPIRELRDVFEAITEVSGRERDVIVVTEQVRVALRRHITQRYLGTGRSISALIAHPELEDALRQALRGAGPTGHASIDPQLLQRVIAEIRAARTQVGAAFERVVLLCSTDVRRHLRRLTEAEFFELPVLSFQELSGDVPVVPVGHVRG
jgi:type III secretion protein V